MPKMKTKSSCKRRFRVTATGKITFKNAGKRHMMIKRSQRQIRNNRKSDILSEGDSAFVSKQFMPYGECFKQKKKVK